LTENVDAATQSSTFHSSLRCLSRSPRGPSDRLEDVFCNRVEYGCYVIWLIMAAQIFPVFSLQSDIDGSNLL
jgi:hypothetical protein